MFAEGCHSSESVRFGAWIELLCGARGGWVGAYSCRVSAVRWARDGHASSNGRVLANVEYHKGQKVAQVFTGRLRRLQGRWREYWISSGQLLRRVLRFRARAKTGRCGVPCQGATSIDVSFRNEGFTVRRTRLLGTRRLSVWFIETQIACWDDTKTINACMALIGRRACTFATFGKPC
jgi:hypothetical protein